MDQPTDDGLNVFLISKKISELKFKACIHGVGGDEIFGGYLSFKMAPLTQKLRLIPKDIRLLLSNFIYQGSIASKKLYSLLRSDLNMTDSYLIIRSIFSEEQKKDLLGCGNLNNHLGAPTDWIKFVEKSTAKSQSLFSATSLYEILQYDANKLLPDGDIMGMSSNLELRFPLLDLDLVNSILNSKNDFSIKNKDLLVRCVNKFPIHLMNRKKTGFTVPIRSWLRPKLTHGQEEIFHELTSKIGLKKKAVVKIFSELSEKSRGSEWLRAWQLYSLAMWSINS